MCGIAGIIELKKQVNHSSSIKRMTDSMTNRGPDDDGFLMYNDSTRTFFGDDTSKNNQHIDLPYLPKEHINNATNIPSKVTFGFRRLSIIDLSYQAHQPMCDKDKKLWIIFNGEIYNYKEVRDELLSLNYFFYSDSDTEVVLNAYKEWGEKSLQKFNGMFSMSILDTAKNEVFLARDRMGIKPLYYYNKNNRFIFASTIRSIVDSKLYHPKVSWEGLWQNYTFSIAQRPNTCFKGIYAVEPAHFFKINLSSGRITKTKYWDIPTGVQDFSLSEKKTVSLLEEALYTSIKYRLHADVEVGTFMSGGIDSTTISAIASKISPNIKAFTLGFSDNYPEYNEVTEAKETAKINAINHIIHHSNPNEIIDNIRTVVKGYEEPYHHLPANYIISKIVADHKVKVVLNGLGGDELFAGYHFYNKIKWWNIMKNFNPLFKIFPGNINSRLDIAKKITTYKNVPQFYTHFHSTYTDSDNQKLFQNRQFSSIDTVDELYSNTKNFTDNIEALSYYNLKSYISNHQTRTVDQFTMNFSIEGRFPFLDHQLIELTFTIPSKYKIKNGSQKYVLRKIAEKHVAPSCLRMGKKGFGLPLEYWYKNELKGFITEKTHALKKRHFFENKEIDLIVKTGNVRKIWHLVMTELWLEEFF